MKDRGFIFFVVSLFLLSFFLVLHDSNASVFSNGSHCVAYKAKKRMMFVKIVDVVGKNCSVTSQVLPDIGGFFAIKVAIPIENFESGEAERDKDVKKLLKVEKQDSLYFTTKKMNKSDWQNLLKKDGRVPIKGYLNIGGSDFPVTAQVKFLSTEKGIEADGKIETTFKDLSLDPPQLFGGVMAQVKQDLELYFHLQSDKTLGFDSLVQ
ncbi:MAG: YceI family protein [Bdellovibrionales bacterium]|nr:YceI family protein [Bdellovibrionales bacterium]